MVLMALVGGLGAGKTLCLTYLAWRNFRKGLKIYSNYHLNGIPYVPVKKIDDVLKMREGFFAGDELWSWIDSRASMKRRNQVIGNFLLTSRKRGVNFAYTVQSFNQIDIRIRRITDFLAVPQLTVNENICRLMVFSYPSLNLIKIYKYKTDPIFKLYDTKEVVKDLPSEDEAKDFKPYPLAKPTPTETWEAGEEDDELGPDNPFDDDDDD